MEQLKQNNSSYHNLSNPLSNFYDDYDYISFWQDRNYENRADKMALSQLLNIAKKNGACLKLIDIGAGPGRMAPLYESFCKKFILLDPSIDQLKEAEKGIKNKEKAEIILADGQNIPLPDASCDTAVCIRVSHHISNPQEILQEARRILKPEGYLIIEVANKLHIKNRIISIFSRSNNHTSVNHRNQKKTEKKNVVFVNHNPKDIATLLKADGFEIIKVLSVSNFRAPLMKKIFPTSFLLFLEKYAQTKLASFWFGPSIYFLAKKTS